MTEETEQSCVSDSEKTSSTNMLQVPQDDDIDSDDDKDGG